MNRLIEQCNQLTKTENCNSVNCKEESDEQKKKISDKAKGVCYLNILSNKMKDYVNYFKSI